MNSCKHGDYEIFALLYFMWHVMKPTKGPSWDRTAFLQFAPLQLFLELHMDIN